MTPTNIDDVLSNLLHYQIDHGKERGITFDEAKAHLKQIVDSIIGEDEEVWEQPSDVNTPSYNDMRKQASQLGRNDLRAEQRKRAEGYGL